MGLFTRHPLPRAASRCSIGNLPLLLVFFFAKRTRTRSPTGPQPSPEAHPVGRTYQVQWCLLATHAALLDRNLVQRHTQQEGHTKSSGTKFVGRGHASRKSLLLCMPLITCRFYEKVWIANANRFRISAASAAPPKPIFRWPTAHFA
jgi:hypothetical protein